MNRTTPTPPDRPPPETKMLGYVFIGGALTWVVLLTPPDRPPPETKMLGYLFIGGSLAWIVLLTALVVKGCP